MTRTPLVREICAGAGAASDMTTDCQGCCALLQPGPCDGTNFSRIEGATHHLHALTCAHPNHTLPAQLSHSSIWQPTAAHARHARLLRVLCPSTVPPTHSGTVKPQPNDERENFYCPQRESIYLQKKRCGKSVPKKRAVTITLTFACAMFWGVCMSTTISKIASAQATAQAEHRCELCLLDPPPSPPFAISHSLQLKPLSLAKQAQVTLIVLYPILKDAKQD
jgi:hypothetical protein